MNHNQQTIINVANQLQRTGKSGASTGERIAAAFVLNRLEFLPPAYSDAVEAWCIAHAGPVVVCSRHLIMPLSPTRHATARVCQGHLRAPGGESVGSNPDVATNRLNPG